MSKSKGHKHRHRTAETKTQKTWRSVLSFFLFLSITVLSLSVCIKVSFVSDNSIVKLFTNSEYISSMRDDIVQFGSDAAELSGIPADCVKDTVTEDAVRKIETAYIWGALGGSEEYTATTYLDYIEALKEDLTAAAQQEVEKNGLTVDENVPDGANQFSASVIDYLQKRVEFRYMDNFGSYLNIAATVSIVAMIASAVMIVLIMLILVSIGKKPYRSIRSVSNAFAASALLELCLAGGVKIVEQFKTLVLYPEYFSNALMGYVERCVISVCAAGGIGLLLSLLSAVIVWKIKHDKSS